MPRPPSVASALRRRVTEAQRTGRLGPEHEVAVAVVLRMAMTLSTPKIGARDLAALSREFVNQVRALGLLPSASSNGDLEALLRELRG
jgi:hypothetical protein